MRREGKVADWKQGGSDWKQGEEENWKQGGGNWMQDGDRLEGGRG